MVTQPRFIQYIFSNVNNLREQRTFHNATTGFLVPLTAVFFNCNPFPWYFSFQLLCCTSFPPLPFIATFSILIILWLLHKFSNICTPEEGWYGQPKYCYKKTIHVVMNQLCSSLWTSHLWFYFFLMSRTIAWHPKKDCEGDCWFPFEMAKANSQIWILAFPWSVWKFCARFSDVRYAGKTVVMANWMSAIFSR